MHGSMRRAQAPGRCMSKLALPADCCWCGPAQVVAFVFSCSSVCIHIILILTSSPVTHSLLLLLLHFEMNMQACIGPS